MEQHGAKGVEQVLHHLLLLGGGGVVSLVVRQLLQEGVDGPKVAVLGSVLGLGLKEDGQDLRSVKLVIIEGNFDL